MMCSNSFTSSFKKFIPVLILVILIITVGKCLNYVYLDDYIDGSARNFWHNFYHYDRGIDSICIGSSHVQCDVDPQVLTDLSGREFYDMSTSALPQNGCYYLLREACREYDIKHVYLEMFYAVNICSEEDGTYVDRIESGRNFNWRNTDYMKPSLNRLLYKLSIGPVENYPEIFVPFIRYRSQLFDDGHFNYELIRHAMRAKRDPSYLNYGETDMPLRDGEMRLLKNGFQDSTITCGPDKFTLYPNVDLTRRKIGDTTKKYIEKIASFCKRNDIELTFFISPMHRLQTMSTVDYDAYHAQVAELAAELDVPFYDFNLAREEYLREIIRPENMIDPEHFNRYGAEKFSTLFWQVISSDPAEARNYFYNSFSEALEQSEPEVYGLWGLDFVENQDGGYDRINRIVSNHPEAFSYDVTILPDGIEAYAAEDLSAEGTFSFPLNGTGTILIKAQNKENGSIRELELPYKP